MEIEHTEKISMTNHSNVLLCFCNLQKLEINFMDIPDAD